MAKKKKDTDPLEDEQPSEENTSSPINVKSTSAEPTAVECHKCGFRDGDTKLKNCPTCKSKLTQVY